MESMNGKHVEQKYIEELEENYRLTGDVLPPNLLLATSCSYDDVADLVIQHSDGNFVFTGVRQNIIWKYDDKTKLWIKVEVSVFAAYINSITRLINAGIHMCKKYGTCAYQDSYLKLLLKLRSSLKIISFSWDITEVIKRKIADPSFTDKLNKNKDLLPLPNGTAFDFNINTIRTRTREDYCTFTCPVNYDPEARSDIINKFLDDITLNDNDLKSYLQIILGRCLIDRNDEYPIHIFYGPNGNDGKNTLISISGMVLGDFYVALSEHRQNRRDVDNLHNRMYYIYDEDLEEYNIQHLCALKNKYFHITNFAKPVKNIEDSMLITIVPFDCVFVDTTADLLPHERPINRSLWSKIINDPIAMRAFFNWLVTGAKRIHSGETIIRPKRVFDATNTYIFSHLSKDMVTCESNVCT